MLSAASSAAVLFNGIKESWRLARKILSRFKLLWFLNVFGNALLAILHLEIAKKLFAAGSAEQLNPPRCMSIIMAIPATRENWTTRFLRSWSCDILYRELDVKE